MSLLSKISEFMSSAGTIIIDSVSNAVDKLVTTTEEKEKLKQELLRLKGEQEQNQRNFLTRMEELTQQREFQLYPRFRNAYLIAIRNAMKLRGAFANLKTWRMCSTGGEAMTV